MLILPRIVSSVDVNKQVFLLKEYNINSCILDLSLIRYEALTLKLKKDGDANGQKKALVYQLNHNIDKM